MADKADKYVYRTQDPEILAAIEQYKTDEYAWRKASRALMRKWFGRGKNAPKIVTRGDHWIGVSVGQGDPPAGWRLERRHWIWVPFRTKPAGKLVAQAMDGCQPPKPPNNRFKGMPAFVMGAMSNGMGLAMHSAGARELDGWLYATWSVELTATPKKDRSYDPAVWEPVPLSQFYAAVEAADAAKADA